MVAKYEIAPPSNIDYSQRPDLVFTPENRSFLQRSIWQESLYDYLLAVWPIIEPGRPFYGGFHIEAVCEHLQAVSQGQIRKLLINIPPRSTKSTLVSVVWPTWEWTWQPKSRFLMSSYGDSLVSRDAIKARDIICSKWYQENWGERFSLKDDQNTIHFYKNSEGGYRISTTPSGQGTGFGGDRIVCDDAHNVQEREHPGQIKDRAEWWAKSMSTRFEDASTASWVVSGQRVALGDISDMCIELGYEHLMIPMEYDPKHKMFEKSPRCKRTSIGWSDPRAEGSGKPEEGNINICPERFTPEVLSDIKKALRIDAEAQLQQDPKPSTGGIFDISKIEIVDATPVRGRRIRYWDKAFTDDGGAYTVGVLLNLQEDGTIYVEDVQRKQMSPARRNQFIKLIAMRDAKLSGNTVTIYVEEEPGAGKESTQIMMRLLRGFPVFADPAKTNKLARAIPIAAQVAAGNVKVLRARWTYTFLDELEYFPNSQFKDQVDGFSGAYNKGALSDMNHLEGDLLMSGDHGETGRLTKDDIRELSAVSPELAEIIEGINASEERDSENEDIDFASDPVLVDSRGQIMRDNPYDEAFRRSEQEFFDLDDEDFDYEDGYEADLGDLEEEIASLLEGSDNVQPGEYSRLTNILGLETEPWSNGKDDENRES